MSRISLDPMQLDVQSFEIAAGAIEEQEVFATDPAKFCTGPLGSCLAMADADSSC